MYKAQIALQPTCRALTSAGPRPLLAEGRKRKPIISSLFSPSRGWSFQMRPSRTASFPATATRARFGPTVFKSFKPQLRRAERFLTEVSSTLAARSRVRLGRRSSTLPWSLSDCITAAKRMQPSLGRRATPMRASPFPILFVLFANAALICAPEAKFLNGPVKRHVIFPLNTLVSRPGCQCIHIVAEPVAAAVNPDPVVDENNQEIVKAPLAAVDIRARSLLKFALAPTQIDLIAPRSPIASFRAAPCGCCQMNNCCPLWPRD